jgi:hypothetical protein
VRIFDLTDPILLPLAPTITGIIAEYLQSIARKLYINALHNCDVVGTQRSPELAVLAQHDGFNISRDAYSKSIRQVPTLPYQYVSTIAHQWAAKLSLTSLAICQQIRSSMPAIAIADERLELDCWYNEAGYIYFQLTPRSIVNWLNYIHDLPLEIDRDENAFAGRLYPQRSSREATSMCYSAEIAVYAHARCCSVLKLARAEKLVEIADNWQINPIDWRTMIRSDPSSNEDRRKTQSAILFEEPGETHLIQALMKVLDGIYNNCLPPECMRQLSIEGEIFAVMGQFIPPAEIATIRSPDWQQLTIDLAQNWLEFYRDCRMFGDIKHQNPRLAIARCGLTAISRRYLQVLLETYLDVSAVVEL